MEAGRGGRLAILTLDGSQGEGGGQVLRTALSLSALTCTAFRMDRVRAGRSSPGLARQHRTAVLAAAEVCGAEVEGAELGSTEIAFRPGRVRSGEYRFSTGGAGSATLVLQTVLLPLMATDAASELTLEGGTHNPWAPPYDFLERSFAPLLRRMGIGLDLALERPGFYPAGGGRIRARIEPAAELRPLDLEGRGDVRERRARAYLSALPEHIAERELGTVAEVLDVPEEARETVEVEEPEGPGNAVVVDVVCSHVTEVFTGFGRKGVPAEEVAREAAEEALGWEARNVAVGPHLADQLLLPLSSAGAGGFTTLEPTAHARTNAGVIRSFLDVEIEFRALDEGRWSVVVSPAAQGAGS